MIYNSASASTCNICLPLSDYVGSYSPATVPLCKLHVITVQHEFKQPFICNA